MKEILQNKMRDKALSLYSKDLNKLNKEELYYVIGSVTNDMMTSKINETNKIKIRDNKKTIHYFSMEFLMGRLLTNNMMNLNIYEDMSNICLELNHNLKDIEIEESDAGLGNGGLGRLAACFLDSLAATNYSGNGITIRYRNGFFKQYFDKGHQVEKPDLWLNKGNVWEQKITSDATKVSFYGEVVESTINNKTVYQTINDLKVIAMPYDMPIIGTNNVCNTLRMYDVLMDQDSNSHNYLQYENEINEITNCLYPDDSTLKGKELRLKQQYLFVSAGLNNIIKRHLENHHSLDNFNEYNVLQINDTHPAMLVAEMMRVLIDDYHYDYDKAWSITNKSIAYTNHTILAEALEKWDYELIESLLPRLTMIINEINKRFVNHLKELNYNEDMINKMAIINNNQVHMAHLAIVGSFSVNGVAALHTQILIEKEMKHWHELYPNKFNNKTNGITQRRWLEYCNKELTKFIIDKTSSDFKTKPIPGFKQLLDVINDNNIKEFEQIKLTKKKQLAKYLLENDNFEIDVNSIFDIQIKRLHSYKRQLLNVLHIIYLYQELKTNPEFKTNFNSQTFIFGAKAAPSYVFAKNVIKLINSIASVINNDQDTNNKLKVCIVENYNVSYAEKLIPAADVSEQISTAGYEASGTGNMKFMMNGALTIGTLDGANVEIYDLVKDDHIFLFGMTKDEVSQVHNSNDYNASNFIESHEQLQSVMNFIKELHTLDNNVKDNEFDPIFKELFTDNDYYLVLKDFDSYKEAQAKLNKAYSNKNEWYKSCLVNIAMSGYFSSDRTIEDYVRDIWKLEKLSV